MKKFTVYYRKREHSRTAYFLPPEEVDLTHYDKVACEEAADIEDLFRRMNCVDGSDMEYVGRGVRSDGRPKLALRSLSVGDVVVSEEGTYLCAGFGWERVEGKGFES